jgi:hypothetical protein
MIKKLMFAATMGAGLFLAGSAGMATTAGSLGMLKGVGTAQSSVEKTHGWHRTCRRGLNGYHRHVPGVGRVQCTAHKCWTNSWGIRRCRWF